ncbi:hypothetical protein M446_2768 [Methylobacterium sp. 4-46]|uniref:hypothetical protein n=1 Tax=unclassified Methylobacterium TaxID=2615210 RepID=UPI000165C844|nr:MULTISPECIES: hypothetical protein [Methylobacterium]ACA17206.1 hypothetical protein M446_2768 [Methylobacterium sp. 4-46]WFT82888.1 hypothetical protein QA634_14025 [Methylobacterium nodulans]
MDDEIRIRVIETALRMIAKHLQDTDPRFGVNVNGRLDAQTMAVASNDDKGPVEKDKTVEFYDQVRRLLNPGR